MLRYIANLLVQLGVVILGVSTVVFLLLRLAGDPALLFVAADDATPERLAQVRTELGFNDPLPLQYARFLASTLQGDFGTSLRFKTAALPLAFDHAPATLELAVLALALSVLLGFPAGVIAATQRGSLLGNTVSVLSLLGQCLPVFWLGIMLILLFAVELRVLPASGDGSPAHFILPTLTLAAYIMARIARLARSSMLEVLGQDYIRTARAKGLAAAAVIVGHAAKNAAIPTVAAVAVSFSTLIGGAVVTETVFGWPGLGRLLVDSVVGRDYPVAQASVFVIAIFVTLANLLSDLAYGLLDPRIRHQF